MMELTLKRYFWMVPVLVVLVCGVLAARGTNQVIEAKYLLGESKKPSARPSAKPTTRPAATRPAPSKDADAVVARNMFCSTCEPPKPVEPPPTATGSGPVDTGRPPDTTLPLALVATVVATGRPDPSTGTIANTQTLKQGSYGIHDTIPDVGEVEQVQAKFVDFHNKNQNNRLERVQLIPVAPGQPQPVAAVAPPVTPAAAPDPANPEAELMAAVDKGVKKIDETHYDIDRALVDKILADPTVVARSARIVPSIQGGKANGFKMYAIRPNSVFARIGMQNGDTLMSVNGFDITSPDKALEVYTKVKSATSLSVSVLRRGAPVSMEYSIK